MVNKAKRGKKTKKGKKIEAPPKIPLSEPRERMNLFSHTSPKSLIEDEQIIPEHRHCNGGLVRQPVKDGGGYTHFEWVFAGNARTTIVSNRRPDYSDHVAWNPKPEWSLGTNTLAIEAKLRKHKQQEGYTEVTPKVQRRGGKRRGAGRPKKGLKEVVI
jgi:hypothetical protein